MSSPSEPSAVHELSASSRHEHLVVYDPAAIPAETPVDPNLETPEPRPAPAPAIKDLAARGQALVIRIPSEDCEATIRVQVNEEVDDRLSARGVVVLTGALLHMPSGEFKANGVEFIVRPGEVRTHSEGESCRVPAGDYEVEVLELIQWKIKNAAATVAAGTTRLERLCDWLIQAYTWCGILLLPGNLLVAPIVVAIAWRSGGWRSALFAAAVVLAVDIFVVGGFWLLEPAKRRFSILSRVSDLRRQLERDHPDLLVSLRTAPEGRTSHVPTFAVLKVDTR